MSEEGLDFDPGVFADLKNDDDTPFFSEEQAGKLDALDKFKGERGLARLAKSYMELESFKGTTANKSLADIKKEQEAFEKDIATKYEGHLAPLKEDATDEEKAAYHAKAKKFFGAPDKIEGYDAIEVPKDIPIDEDAMTAFKQWGFNNNKTIGEMQDILNIQLGMIQRQKEAFDASQDEAQRVTEKILTKEFGGKEAYVEKCENIKRLLRARVNPDWRKVDEEMDEPWQKFKQDVYVGGIANNDVLMSILGEALDKGVGKVEGKTHVEMHGSTPVEKKHLDKTWEELNPGVPAP